MNYDHKKRNPVLREALEAEARAEHEQYFTGERETFSPEFEQNMARLVERTRRRELRHDRWIGGWKAVRDWVEELIFGEYRRAGYYTRLSVKREAVCLLVISLLVFTTGMAPAPASSGETELIFSSTIDGYTVQMRPQNGYVCPDTLETLYVPAQLPDGYNRVFEWFQWENCRHKYWHNAQAYGIQLTQVILNSSIEIDTEGMEGKPVSVGRYRGRLYVCSSHILLLWTTDYGFVLKVDDPQITPEQVIELAKNLTEETR